MLQPKRTKIRKKFKGRIHGDAKGVLRSTSALSAPGDGARPYHGTPIRKLQRRAISRHIKRAGRLWIRIFPDAGHVEARESAWVRVRVLPNSGPPVSSRAGSCSSFDGVPYDVAKGAFGTCRRQAPPIKTKVTVRLGEPTGEA